MSPKTATTVMSVAVLLLSLTSLTLSSAVCSDCPGFGSVPDILKHYDLPPGVFPNDVKNCTCDAVNKTAYRLWIQLYGVCKVTREVITVVCQPEISATISYRQLTNIKGVTVTVTFLPRKVMTVTEAKAFPCRNGKCLQFFSDKGSSPRIPFYRFQKPPPCDNSSNAAVDHSAVAAAQDVPLWVSKYGRLLPFVAA